MLRFLFTAAICLVATVVVLSGGANAQAGQKAKPSTQQSAPGLPSGTDAESGAPKAASLVTEQEQTGERFGVRMPVVTPKMRRYTLIRRVLYFTGTAFYWLLLWAILRSGLSRKLRDKADSVAKPRWLRLIVYYVLLTLLLNVASWPLSFYSGFVLQHQYGLSSQPFAQWIGDILKSLGVGLVTTIPVIWLVFWAMGRFPRRWPLVLWAASIPIIAAAIFAQPLIVDPVFNKFTPLAQSPLRDRIHALAVQAGIPNAPIVVSDVSKQTNTTNAYVNGIGSSARIVLWDTLLKGKNKMPDDQILAIVGHEMGHYVLKHIYWGFLEAVGGLLIVIPLLRWTYDRLVYSRLQVWKLDGPGDYAAIPALLLTFAVISFASNPVVNALSRHVEHQADEYGLQVTRNPKAMAEAFVALSEQNLSDPQPPKLITLLLGSHPPLNERIDYALSYCPEYGCTDSPSDKAH